MMDSSQMDKLLDSMDPINAKFMLVPGGCGLNYAKLRLRQCSEDKEKILETISIFEDNEDIEEVSRWKNRIKPLQKEIAILKKDIGTAKVIFSL